MTAEAVLQCSGLVARNNDVIMLRRWSHAIHIFSKVLLHGAESEHYIDGVGWIRKKLIRGWVGIDHKVYGSGWEWI